MSAHLVVAACAAGVLAALAPSTAAAEGPAEKPRLIVLELTAAGGVDPSIVGALSEAVTSEAAARGFFQVISSREVATLIGLERQRELLGCNEDSAACLAELSGALGARFVMSGTVARLGDSYQLSLQTLDTQKTQTLGRSTRIATTLESLRQLVPWAVAECTGTPMPPPPSRVVQYSLIGAGSLALVLGGIVGQDALSESRAVQDELNRGRTSGAQLQTFAYYEQKNRDLQGRQLLALGGMAVGAALIATGVLTMPGDVTSPTSVAVVPSLDGVSVVGAWP